MAHARETVSRTAGGMFASNGDMAYRPVGKNGLDQRVYRDHVNRVHDHLHDGAIGATMGSKPDVGVKGSANTEDYLAYLASKHTAPTAYKPVNRHRRTQPNPPKKEVSNDTLYKNGSRGLYTATAHENYGKATSKAIGNMNSRVDHVSIKKDGRTMDNGQVVETWATGTNVVYPVSATEQVHASLATAARDKAAVLREIDARMATHKWDRVLKGRVPNPIAIASAPSEPAEDTRRQKKQNLRADRSTRVAGDTSYYANNAVGQRPDEILVRSGIDRTFEARTEFPTRSAYALDQRGGNVENILPSRTKGLDLLEIERKVYGTSRQYNTAVSAIKQGKVTYDYDKEFSGRESMVTMAHNRIGRTSGKLQSDQEVNRTQLYPEFHREAYSGVARQGLREQSQRHVGSSRNRFNAIVDATGYTAAPLVRREADLWKPGPRYMQGEQDDQILAN